MRMGRVRCMQAEDLDEVRRAGEGEGKGEGEGEGGVRVRAEDLDEVRRARYLDID